MNLMQTTFLVAMKLPLVFNLSMLAIPKSLNPPNKIGALTK